MLQKNKIHKRGTALLAAILMLAGSATAQLNSTLYFMRDLPLRNQLNPAFQPEAGTLFIGVPLFTSVYTDIGATLSGINFSNIMSSRPRLSQIADNVRSFEGAYARMDYSLLNVGWEYRDMYFTFDVISRINAEVNLPGDLLRLGWYGNGPYLGRAMSLTGFGEYMNWYTEISLGFTREIIHERLSVGGRVKRLMGTALVDAHFASGSYFYTDPETWAITVGITPDVSVAGVPMDLKDKDNVKMKDLMDLMPNSPDFLRHSKLFNGGGWGIDMGIELKNEHLNVSGSLLNFGAIRWKRASHAVPANPGLTVQTFTGAAAGSEEMKKDVVDMLFDTITTITELSTSSENVLRWTSPTIAFAATYKIGDHFNAGLLGAVTIGQYNTYPLFSAALSTQSYPINATVTYTYVNRTNNLGLGLVFGRRGLQLHIITDNLIAVNYERVQRANIRVGLNLLLGPRQALNGQKRALEPLNITPNGDKKEKPKQKAGALNSPSSPTNGATPRTAPPSEEQKMPLNQPQQK